MGAPPAFPILGRCAGLTGSDGPEILVSPQDCRTIKLASGSMEPE